MPQMHVNSFIGDTVEVTSPYNWNGPGRVDQFRVLGVVEGKDESWNDFHRCTETIFTIRILEGTNEKGEPMSSYKTYMLVRQCYPNPVARQSSVHKNTGYWTNCSMGTVARASENSAK